MLFRHSNQRKKKNKKNYLIASIFIKGHNEIAKAKLQILNVLNSLCAGVVFTELP